MTEETDTSVEYSAGKPASQRSGPAGNERGENDRAVLFFKNLLVWGSCAIMIGLTVRFVIYLLQ